MVHVEEGTVRLRLSATDEICHTWYKTFGDLSSNQVPLIILHGGPGACHEYLLRYQELTGKFGIPTIFYDQIGNGQSTHLPEKKGDGNFWTEDLFIDELNNLVDNLGLRERGFDILGHSWGGMLGSVYACSQPVGLRRVIISNAPAAVYLWEEAAKELVSRLPEDTREILENEQNLIGSEKYDAAMVVFRKKYFCKVDSPEIQLVSKHLLGDPTVHTTMKGSSEISITGTLKDWSVIDRLHKLQCPVLLLNGEDDQAQDNTVKPFVDAIQTVKWEKIENASHNPHLEQTEQVIDITSKFLLAEKSSLLGEVTK